MTIDLTRRTLLHLAGASSLSAAAIAAAEAEGTPGGGPTANVSMTLSWVQDHWNLDSFYVKKIP